MQWWIILQPLIDAWIQSCLENRSLAEIEEGMATPGVVEKAAMNQLLHEAGIRGKRRKRRVRQGMNRLRRANRREVRAFLERVPNRADAAA